MKIKRILIANRGEIAVRIIRTAHKMNIEVVAIRTAVEPAALFLSQADIVYDNTEDASEIPVFLNIDKIIEIAIKTKADAIHPGYGFLAENAYFAQKCIENRITYIGPSPDAIYKMGNKTIARKLAVAADIPVAMGTRKRLFSPQIRSGTRSSSRLPRAEAAEACGLCGSLRIWRRCL
jgi:acetyl-CoA carboxylase biotin carboxylase subunit